MMSVWKYAIPQPLMDRFTVVMPEGAKVLCIQLQYGRPCLWALVDAAAKVEERRFYIVVTGHDADGVENMTYIGTFQTAEDLVLHVFEAVKIKLVDVTTHSDAGPRFEPYQPVKL